MLNKKTIGVLILAIAGLGALDAVNIPLKAPSSPSNAPKVVKPSETTLAALSAVREALRASESKSQIVGLFAAVADQIEIDRNLSDMEDVKLMNELLFSGYLQRVGFEPVPGLGAKIDEFIFGGDERLRNPSQKLTPEVRAILSERYRALEWVIQNDRNTQTL